VNAQELITEKDFQATVIALARTYGWIVGFTHDARKSEPGEPDLRMVHPTQHRVIFAELKTVKGKLTKGRYNKSGNRWLPGQDEWGDALTSSGVEYYLWRPDGLDGEIERILGGNDA
jgi:hypothetical protein